MVRNRTLYPPPPRFQCPSPLLGCPFPPLRSWESPQETDQKGWVSCPVRDACSSAGEGKVHTGVGAPPNAACASQ